MTSELYTASRLRVLRACLRQHHYRYGLGLQTLETELMRFGTVGHKALEAYYREWQKGAYSFVSAATGFDIDAPITKQDRYDARVRRLDAALAAIDASDLSPFDRIKLSVMVRAYDARWGAKNWRVIAVEVEFRYMLGDRLIGGKIDVIIEDLDDGRIYVVEHKTTGADASLGSPYWERLSIDTQVSIYIDGAGVLGHDIAGCIYDVLKRPAHEPKLATPPEKREYTKGKGCKGCGGSGGGKAGIVQGRGHYLVAAPGDTEPTKIPCERCSGTGWLNDAEGKPQAPRLHSHQRDTDETGEDYEARLVEAIAENPDAFLLRGVVVRLEHELPGLRQDILDDIDRAETGATPRNSDACARGGSMCSFFTICSGAASTNDFTRGPAHPELDAATTT